MFLIIALIFPTITYGGEWNNQFGLSYSSSFSDVEDLYKDNLERSGYRVEDVSGLPVGASYSGHYQFNNGFFVGGGLGPIFLILGDVSHSEIAVNGKIGWTFFSGSTVSPFISAGISKHIVTGDYVEGDSAGPLVEAGIKINQFGVKVTHDGSEVVFQSEGGNKTLNSYDTIVTLFFEF